MAAPAYPDLPDLELRARLLLGLLALMPDGVRDGALVRTYRHGGFERSPAQLGFDDVQALLGRVGVEVPWDARLGFCLVDRDVRRSALDWLVASGIAATFAQRFDAAAAERLSSHYYHHELPPPLALGVRLALLGGAPRAALLNACTRFGTQHAEVGISNGTRLILVDPVDAQQIERLHPSIRLDWCLRQLALRMQRPALDTPFWHRQALACVALQPVASSRRLYEHALLRQDVSEMARFGGGEEWAPLQAATLLAMNGERDAALTALQSLYEAQVAPKGRARSALPGLAGLLLALALAAEPGIVNLAQLAKLVRGADTVSEDGMLAGVAAALRYAQASVQAQLWFSGDREADPPLFEGWTLLVLTYWSGQRLSPGLLDWAQRTLPALRASAWNWLAEHFAAAIGEPDAAPAGPWLWCQPEAPWKRALRAIERFARPESEAKSARSWSRIRAHVRPHSYAKNHAFVELRELRPTTKGGWTSGRLIESPRAAEEAVQRLDPEDLRGRQLLADWRRSVTAPYQRDIDLNSPLMDALVDYPYVVGGEDASQPLSVTRLAPRLRIQRTPDGFAHVQIDPAPDGQSRRNAQWEPGRLVLTDFDAEMLRLAGALGGNAIFPESALPALMVLAPQLSRRIDVDADLGAAESVSDLDARIHLIIEPLREGLRLRLRTRPLGADGVYFVPGAGTLEILGLRDGAAVRGRRKLVEEQRALEDLLQAVPALAGGETGDAIDLPNAEAALETLSQLVELGDALVLDWSTDRRWSLTRTQNFGQLALKVRAQRDWFHAEGGLTLDDGSVVSLATLLEALPSSQGRFVRLADDRIVALSQALARQLRQVRTLADERGRLELAPVAAGALQALIDAGAEVDLDQAYQDQLDRIARAEEIQATLPADLQAELRDYQIEGYRWLMRLASWGAGACLADDMGLGKTLQALAALLARAPLGPALVIAPTSVVPNWRNEAQRFAPTLELRWYGEGDRSKALDQLGPGNVVLVSYGLLTNNIDAFAEIRFSTLVLDEAQAIKNAAAQRSQAIRRLQADFRVATTGTPIENHLGELWSLMRVLNPGLLGSQERFGKRFMLPIERETRGPEREALRRLISPFMLRRLKSQVLAELPPRTEIVLSIEPSPGEARLLAAVRRQAIERLETGALPEEAKRFHVLAELTRMRRAACHPSLVAPELNLSGAKLEQLLELVSELKENRHRALVFSQFVDYLDLVRAAFDQAGISYQYLDGSTPSKAREAAVSAFQRGEGDVFLLSLKAGGVGLNLTAADYVIHLDPWWNPAVEQQATDRAHRIGQTRPVTVYKLVVKGSIEEQILALHGAKREIADSVLADQDGATRLSVTELIGLLGAGGE